MYLLVGKAGVAELAASDVTVLAFGDLANPGIGMHAAR